MGLLAMSGPYAAVQAAIVSALTAAPALAVLTGIYDGPPPRAAFPYASFSSNAATDWGTKTEAGRELRLAITLWDDGESPARLHQLVAALEAVVATLPTQIEGWRIVSLVLTRTLIARDPQGPWAGLVEHRLRLFKT